MYVIWLDVSCVFFFKQKTAYEMRISDWSSDVCSSDLTAFSRTAKVDDTTIGWRFKNKTMHALHGTDSMPETAENVSVEFKISREDQDAFALLSQQRAGKAMAAGRFDREIVPVQIRTKIGIKRSEEHTSELQSLMRTSSAVF